MDPNENIFEKARDILKNHYPHDTVEKMLEDSQPESTLAVSNQ